MNSIPYQINIEDVSCPNGCTEKSNFVLKGKDHLHNLSGIYQIVKCSKCGLQRTSPRPNAESIGYYYPDDYGPYKDVPFKPVKASGIKGLLFKLMGMESRILPSCKPSKMLELGCSTGSYMEYVRSIGWDVDGIEFSEKAARIAKSKGFNVQIGRVEDLNPVNRPYDVIVAWMVMEHLHNPSIVLQKIQSWLSVDGYFVFLVPDVNSISRRIFKDESFDTQLPTHLFHYTPASLNTLLENNGMKVEKIFYQRNANTFLKSIEIWSKNRNYINILNFFKWFNSSSKTNVIRLMLSFIFGITRQSGRIEIWAKLKK